MQKKKKILSRFRELGPDNLLGETSSCLFLTISLTGVFKLYFLGNTWVLIKMAIFTKC